MSMLLFPPRQKGRQGDHGGQEELEVGEQEVMEEQERSEEQEGDQLDDIEGQDPVPGGGLPVHVAAGLGAAGRSQSTAGIMFTGWGKDPAGWSEFASSCVYFVQCNRYQS